MGILNKQLVPSAIPPHKKILPFVSPMSGKVVRLDEVPHALFQQRIFGEGVAISPSGYQVFAPFNGVVTEFNELANQMRIKATNGLLLQIQLGIDSHLMMGVGFKRKKLAGQKFQKNDVLAEFSLVKMKKALPSTLCPITLVNSEKVLGIEGHYYSVLAKEDIIMSIYI